MNVKRLLGFAAVGGLLIVAPTESVQQKIEMGVDPKRLELLFDVLGRWHVSPQFPSNLKGLLTEAEVGSVKTIMHAHCPSST